MLHAIHDKIIRVSIKFKQVIVWLGNVSKETAF